MAPAQQVESPLSMTARSPVYYGWVVLGIAALAMVGTLPGRTQGLGLITEPLLRDLQLGRTTYAELNLIATLLGSMACLGFGRLIDRFGSRKIMTGVALGLGAAVWSMSHARGIAGLALGVTLTRALGQSALSVASLSVVPLWFQRRQPMAMALYSVLLSIGFMIAFPLVGVAVDRSGWRVAWSGIGLALLLVLVPLSAFAMRRNPASCGLRVDGETNSLPGTSTPGLKPVPSDTLGSALARPQFWIFAIGSALYGLVASGLGLFNESILAERGFPAGIYHTSLAITAITGLAGNFLGGWLMGRYAPTRLLAAAMGLLAAGLGLLPHLATVGGVMAQAAGMGIAGGLVTVLFFSIWSRYFGRLHLATIQGAAQTLTVLGSALGPLWLAKVVDWTGSYAAGFRTMGLLVAGVGIWALLVREPAETLLPNSPAA